MPVATLPFLVGPHEGDRMSVGATRTSLKLHSALTDGRLAIVQHTLLPRRLAAPMHRHSREDEISIVLSGRLGAKLGDDIVMAAPGSYLLKPRGQWHTYWNAGDTDLTFCELLVPAGVEGYFDRLSRLFAAGRVPGDDSVRRLADEYGLQFDVHSVPELCRQFGLRW
jgi:mannose-6-phosphate isomerase-like protein (cupin superfamily)